MHKKIQNYSQNERKKDCQAVVGLILKILGSRELVQSVIMYTR